MAILGLDIGGANIKAADEMGRAVSRPFAIWRSPERLNDELATILNQFPDVESVAVTMTAELADCFQTKSEGVQFILDSINTVMECFRFQRSLSTPSGAPSDSSPLMVWTTDGRFYAAEKAREMSDRVAAANWHALATWCGRFAPNGHCLLVDIGTTTTDVIPLRDGQPVPLGLTDLARLQSGELSYSGARRTPLCAIANSVPFREGYCSLASELFATSLDVYLLTGEIKDDELDLETANGKPATRDHAWDRIARMLCCDRDEVSINEAVHVARFLADVQRQRLAGSLERVVQRLGPTCETVIISGSGTFLARRLVWENRKTQDAKLIVLSDQCSPAVAESACAYAVAQLATQHLKSQ